MTSKTRVASLAIPILVIAVGVGWLLRALGYTPPINWLWTLGLAAAGILTFALSGWNKVSVVIGPFFLLSSVLSVFRQTGGLTVNVEVPVLVISVGVFLLVARLPVVPSPGWMHPLPPPPDEPSPNPPKKLKL